MNLIRFEPPAKELPKRRSAAHGGLEPPRSRRLCEDVLSISVAMSGRRRRLLRAGYSPIYPKTEAAAELRAEGNRESGCRKGGQKNRDRPLPEEILGGQRVVDTYRAMVVDKPTARTTPSLASSIGGPTAPEARSKPVESNTRACVRSPHKGSGRGSWPKFNATRRRSAPWRRS